MDLPKVKALQLLLDRQAPLKLKADPEQSHPLTKDRSPQLVTQTIPTPEVKGLRNLGISTQSIKDLSLGMQDVGLASTWQVLPQERYRAQTAEMISRLRIESRRFHYIR